MRRANVPLVAIGSLVLGAATWSMVREVETPRRLGQNAYATSTLCTRCHGDHQRSFARTFHRTMTQLASERSVLGNFNDQTLAYFGSTTRFTRGPDGEFLVTAQSASFEPITYRVVKAVGSHRYQQYLGESSGALVRLPVAWHIEEGRWFHMNGAFLTRDPEPSANAGLTRSDYERHVTRWNDNCVFCHNVGPNPGMREDIATGAPSFNTHVEELGVACEACHGPGEEHQRINASPLRRYFLHLSGAADPTIVNPSRLSPERSADICGRCHGQRITDDVNAFLRHGDPFVPGEDLSLYSAPLWRDTTLQGREGVFAPRFWPDGSPRLTAYEYQGMLLSRCASEGGLTCSDCHGMHEGDPSAQLRPSRRGAAMCIRCHEELEDPSQQRAHAHHDLRDGSPSCVDCHMPKIVYGVLDTHVSHRIESPDPAKHESQGRPDSCTLCHLERTRVWAAQARERLWGTKSTALPAQTSLSETETRALAGDPIERVIAVGAYAEPKRARGARTDFARTLLLDVMTNDPYPVVRRFARNALMKLVSAEEANALAKMVPEEPLTLREQHVREFERRFGSKDAALEGELFTTLRERARDVAIEIGE